MSGVQKGLKWGHKMGITLKKKCIAHHDTRNNKLFVCALQNMPALRNYVFGIIRHETKKQEQKTLPKYYLKHPKTGTKTYVNRVSNAETTCFDFGNRSASLLCTHVHTFARRAQLLYPQNTT